jgi:hypothetical protein
VRRATLLAVALLLALLTACGGRVGNPLGTEYEYEEDLTLSLDGSATLVVNASVPALVVLRGLALPVDLASRADQLKEQVRALYASSGTTVKRVNTWTRRNRRYVGVHVAVSDIRALPSVAPFSWSTYDLHTAGERIVFRQTLSRPASAASPSSVGLTGDELVAFRLHLPARIRFQNSRYLDRDQSRPTARGNIVTWEQRLVDRLKGQPIAYAQDRKPDVMEAEMDRESILYRTLWLFAIAFVAALAVLAGLIWFTMRRGDPAPSSHPH